MYVSLFTADGCCFRVAVRLRVGVCYHLSGSIVVQVMVVVSIFTAVIIDVSQVKNDAAIIF